MSAQCPAPVAQDNHGPARKHYRRGTHRTVAPRQTLARVRPLMAPLGITRLANVTGLDRIGIPVIMACRPNSRSVAVSQGKGLTLEAAQASALMESLETYHAERIELPLRLASHAELVVTEACVDVDALPPVAGSRFRPTLPILWAQGKELFGGEPRWLPYETVHTNYALPLPGGSGCFASSSNGLASGNHFLEAVVHGLCEVIERDATSVWHHLDPGVRDAARLDLGSVRDPACREVIARLDHAGLSVAAWDTTTDLGVPCCYCVLADAERDDAHPGIGAGCHPTREIALLRALLEAVQVRTTYIAGSRDDLARAQYTAAGRGEKLRYARALMAAPAPRRDFAAMPSHEFDTFAEDLAWLLERLAGVGVAEAVAVDLTRPRLGIAVAKVVIPGLEGPHDDDRYLAGPRARAAGAARAEGAAP